MKSKLKYIAFFTIFCFVICSHAQEISKEDSEAKWTRIETDAKDLSIAFPPHFIVDAEKRERGQRFQITGFANNVRMEITIYKDSNAVQRIQGSRPQGSSNFSAFEKNSFRGTRAVDADTDKIYKETISLIKDDYYYVLRLLSNDKSKSEIERFLYSIKLKGDNLFVTPKPTNYSEETVLFSSLKTNPEVLEAYARKFEKKKGKVSTELSSNSEEFITYEKYSRPPVILHRPRPSFVPKYDGITGGFSYSALVKLELLASGQVGDIVILSSDDKKFTDACVESARKIRFIPGQINGVSVDSTYIVDYSILGFSVVTNTTTTLPGQKPF
jgi:hypothetical protein